MRSIRVPLELTVRLVRVVEGVDNTLNFLCILTCGIFWIAALGTDCLKVCLSWQKPRILEPMLSLPNEGQAWAMSLTTQFSFFLARRLAAAHGDHRVVKR
jgi:hypothetical protein